MHFNKTVHDSHLVGLCFIYQIRLQEIFESKTRLFIVQQFVDGGELFDRYLLLECCIPYTVFHPKESACFPDISRFFLMIVTHLIQRLIVNS